MIDADALKHKIDQEEGRRIEPGWYDGIDTCREIIENAPTIDVIPVEWLKAHKTEYLDDWGEEPVSVEAALRIWQKEQETQDG